MTIFCPRCGEQNSGETIDCISCAFPLAEVSAIVKNGGKDNYWVRIAITLLIFVSLPLFLLKVGERINKDFYEYFAGFVLVLLLPGLPWIVSAVLRSKKQR